MHSPGEHTSTTMPFHDRSGHLRPEDAAGSNTRLRSRSPHLQLAGLGRFHPLNFPNANPLSAATSLSTSPNSNLSSPAAPSSPRQHYQHLSQSPYNAYRERRQYTDVPQRQLHDQQKDMVHSRYHSSNSGQLSPNLSSTGLLSIKPASPRLAPKRVSDDPMTPLELEEREGYFFSKNSNGSSQQLNEDAKNEIVDTYINKEFVAARPKSPIMRPKSPRYLAVKKGDPTRHRSHLSR